MSGVHNVWVGRTTYREAPLPLVNGAEEASERHTFGGASVFVAALELLVAHASTLGMQ